MDVDTIANAVRKRIKPLVGTEPGGFSALVGFPDVTVIQFKDAVGVAIAVAILGTVFPLAAKLPVEPSHLDVVNVCDRFAEGIKRIRRARLAPRDWELERRKGLQ